MEKHASDIVNYLRIPKNQIEFLANIRHWDNLKLGYEADFVWIKALTIEQVNSVAIKSIPFHVAYYEQEQQLSLMGSLLPHCSIPQILWTPIQRALPIQLPTLNHNYFGTSEKISIQIVPSNKEQEGFALLSHIEDLDRFIKTSSAIRLKPLKWCIIEDKALLFGIPFLPIQGAVYWKSGQFLIPAGYDFNYPTLAQSIQHNIVPNSDDWIVWSTDSNYYCIESSFIQTLSLSSYRKTISIRT